MRRGDIWTVAGAKGYAGKPRPVVIVQNDSFDATDSLEHRPPQWRLSAIGRNGRAQAGVAVKLPISTERSGKVAVMCSSSIHDISIPDERMIPIG